MAGVRLVKLSKAFGATRAVHEVDLAIPDGEFTVFVGPSGCGKTTTLNLIAGLEGPTSGDIYIGDDRVTDWEPRDRNLGMVFQSLALFPHMSVFDNIAFPLRIKKVPAGEVASRVVAVAKTVRVDHLLGKRPATLSGGEAQRVALARTIIVKPAVFLMDEPLSSLDAKLRVEMRTELKRLHATLKATFIYVTHDQAEAMTMADRIVVMSKGRIEQLGTPLEIYNRPATRFVAGFFGTPTMNFIEGVVEAGPSGARFRGPGLEQPLPANLSSDLDGCDVALGIRSEHVVIDGADGISGTARLLEPLGDVTLVHFDAADGRSLVAKVAPGSQLAPGAALQFRFLAEQCHLFDMASGQRRA